MRQGRFLLTALSAAMFASMLAGCAAPVVVSELTEINRQELMKQAETQLAAYEDTEALVLAAEDALHEAAPREAQNWEFASKAARRAAEKTINLYRLEAAAGHAKLREIRAGQTWQQFNQELAHEDWNVVELGFLAILVYSSAKARAEAEKAETARFSPESVEAANNALVSANAALGASADVLKQAAPTEWAVRLTAIAERDIAWAELNQAVDLIAKGQSLNPVPPESVVVFQAGSDIPKHIKIGVLTHQGRDEKQVQVLEVMRKKAGELGANALIWDKPIQEKEKRGVGLTVVFRMLPRYRFRGSVIRISEETEDRE